MFFVSHDSKYMIKTMRKVPAPLSHSPACMGYHRHRTAAKHQVGGTSMLDPRVARSTVATCLTA